MEFTEKQIIEKYAKQSMYCTRNTILLYEYKRTWFSFGYVFLKQQREFTEIQKKIKFLNHLKYARKKIMHFFDVYRIHAGENFIRIFNVLSRLKEKILKVESELIQKILKYETGF